MIGVSEKEVGEGIGRGIAVLEASDVPPPRQGKKSTKLLKGVISEDEDLLFEYKQSRLHTLSPSRIIATTKKMIIVQPSFWGLYTGHDIFSKTRYAMIPYAEVRGIEYSPGMILSTIRMQADGIADQKKSKNRGEIRGIKIDNAVVITNFIEEVIGYKEERKSDYLEYAEEYAKERSVERISGKMPT